MTAYNEVVVCLWSLLYRFLSQQIDDNRPHHWPKNHLEVVQIVQIVLSPATHRFVEVIKAKWKVHKALNCNKGAVQSVPKCTETVPQYPPAPTQLDMQSLFWRVEVHTVLTSSSSGSRPEWLPDCQWPAGPHSTLHRFSIRSTEIYCNILATHTTLYKFPVVSERTEIYWRHILATLHYTSHFILHKFPIVVICSIALW